MEQESCAGDLCPGGGGGRAVQGTCVWVDSPGG